MGRYPLPPGSSKAVKTATLAISLSPAEKEQIIQLAGLAGLSVSAFLVGCALGDRIGGVIKGEGFTPSSALNPVQKATPKK